MKNKMEYAFAGGASADTGSTFSLSGTSHKWIAMISMLIDHIGAVVVEYDLYYRAEQNVFKNFWKVAMASGCMCFNGECVCWDGLHS